MTDATSGAPRRRRIYGAPKNWRDIFIAKLGETSNVAEAAEAADISVSWVYKTRRADPAFARRWYDALCEGYDNLEIDLLYRLRTGKTEEVDAEGKTRKFDLGTAFRCLFAHRDTVQKEKGRRTMAEESATIASIEAKIEAMRAREEEAERLLAKGIRADGD
jgi:transcriptional antiterminator Rof (Rho-off)